MHKLGPGGYALLHHWEQGPHGGPALVPYRCPAGKWTNGWGHVLPEGWQGTITPAVADQQLEEDLTWACDDVERHVTVPLSQNQFDALVCFTFNIGKHGFDTSTLLRELNAGDAGDVPTQLLRWNHANGGAVVDGLTHRREAEVQLWQTKSAA